MKKIFCSLLVTALMSSMIPLQSSALVILPGGEPNPATVKAALTEFKNLSKQEKKERIKEVKKQWKMFKKGKENKQVCKGRYGCSYNSCNIVASSCGLSSPG